MSIMRLENVKYAYVTGKPVLRGISEELEAGKMCIRDRDVLEDEAGLYFLNRSGEVISNRQMAILKSFPNVILSPHTAFYTDEAVSDMCRCVFESVRAFEAGEVNPLEA